MKLDRIVAVSGRSGLFRLISNQSNGLIVEDIESGKRSFASGRLHDFTPLESVSVYTTDEESTVELSKVFAIMHEQIAENPLPASNASSNDIRAYFERILPLHDREKVLISHIKKITRWYAFLEAQKLLIPSEPQAETTETTEAK
jgi:hypothetical protein